MQKIFKKKYQYEIYLYKHRTLKNITFGWQFIFYISEIKFGLFLILLKLFCFKKLSISF